MDTEKTSRPKIHRLPQNAVKEGELYISRTVLIVCVALLLVAVIPALWSFRKTDNSTVENSRFLAPSKNGAFPMNTTTMQNDNGQLVGQLARMPADGEKGASIDSMSKIDPKSGKELMHIIGKH